MSFLVHFPSSLSLAQLIFFTFFISVFFFFYQSKQQQQQQQQQNTCSFTCQCVDGSFGGIDSAWVYFFVVYLLYFISLDFVVVAMESFSAELTPTYSDRSCMYGVIQVFTVIGIGIGVLAPGIISDSKDIFLAACGFAACLIASSWAVAGCFKERGLDAMATDIKVKKQQVGTGRSTNVKFMERLLWHGQHVCFVNWRCCLLLMMIVASTLP